MSSFNSSTSSSSLLRCAVEVFSFDRSCDGAGAVASVVGLWLQERQQLRRWWQERQQLRMQKLQQWQMLQRDEDNYSTLQQDPLWLQERQQLRMQKLQQWQMLQRDEDNYSTLQQDPASFFPSSSYSSISSSSSTLLRCTVEVFPFDRPGESCSQQQLWLKKQLQQQLLLLQEQEQQLQEQQLQEQQQLRQEQQQLRQEQQQLRQQLQEQQQLLQEQQLHEQQLQEQQLQEQQQLLQEQQLHEHQLQEQQLQEQQLQEQQLQEQQQLRQRGEDNRSTRRQDPVRDMDESEAAKLIKVQRPELKKWIGRDPTYLLDYLESRGLIHRDKYHEAKDINVKVERADFLINEFIDRKECLILWRTLESLQDKYPQLTEWISDYEELLPVHETPRSNGVVSDYLHMDSSISEASKNVEAKENHSREREKLPHSEPPKKPTPRPRRGRW
ncbi:unnamed protein product [Lampetra planeri]